MPQRRRPEGKPGAPTQASAPGDAVALLEKVRALRETMNETPPSDAAASGGRSGIDVSNDLEKDINVDAPINNNAACTITHHSNITVNYYNFENPDEIRSPGGLTLYGVWLPRAFVAALDRLRAASGKDRNDLAKTAYEPLLERFGIDVAAPEQAEPSASNK